MDIPLSSGNMLQEGVFPFKNRKSEVRIEKVNIEKDIAFLSCEFLTLQCFNSDF